MDRKKVGLIVNPLAGLGGQVGLKGSDGPDTVKHALELGAKPAAPGRVILALKILADLKENILIHTVSGDMGENEAIEAGLDTIVVSRINSEIPTADDTIKAARIMAELQVDLLIFAGGDGTARDICGAIGNRIPVIGIPAGVKIHSAVYAVNPRSAGEAAAQYLANGQIKLKEAEVMDIDEELFRSGSVSAKLYGYMTVPEVQQYMQNVKSASHSEEASLDGIASDIISNMEPDVYYIIGPGTTTRSVNSQLGLENTLLGIDIVQNKRTLLNDAMESQIYDIVSNGKAKIIITAIGGQGHILGRGNQQLSKRVIERAGLENIIVVATNDKLLSLNGKPLLVDTGDVEFDKKLSGYIQVVTGFGERMIYRVSS